MPGMYVRLFETIWRGWGRVLFQFTASTLTATFDTQYATLFPVPARARALSLTAENFRLETRPHANIQRTANLAKSFSRRFEAGERVANPIAFDCEPRRITPVRLRCVPLQELTSTDADK